MYITDGQVVSRGDKRFLPGAEGKTVVAVGFLDHRQEYQVGDTTPEFQQRLEQHCRLSERRVEWGGFHACEFCGRWLGSHDILVPSGEMVFWAPVLIHHYVTAHQYLPPADFIDAVLNGPIPEPGDSESHSETGFPGVRKVDTDERSRHNYDELDPSTHATTDEDIPEWRKDLRKRLTEDGGY